MTGVVAIAQVHRRTAHVKRAVARMDVAKAVSQAQRSPTFRCAGKLYRPSWPTVRTSFRSLRKVSLSWSDFQKLMK